MNIFCTDDDPYVSARNLDDKRVVKMIVESCQMLSTTLRFYGVDDDGLYRSAFVNHPCTKWVRENKSNYDWLLEHTIALLKVYTFRFGRVHSSSRLIKLFKDYRYLLDDGVRQPFVNCTPYNLDTVISSYRLFMVYKWRINDVRAVTFTNDAKPEWYSTFLPLVLRDNGISLIT